MKRKDEFTFWQEWLKGGSFKRAEIVEKLPFFKMCLGMKDNKMWRHTFATFLNGYFEDLANVVEFEAEKRRKM